MSRRPRRVLALTGVLGLAACVAATQDSDRPWKVHAKDRPQPAMVMPGSAGTATTPGTAPSDAVGSVMPTVEY